MNGQPAETLPLSAATTRVAITVFARIDLGRLVLAVEDGRLAVR